MAKWLTGPGPRSFTMKTDRRCCAMPTSGRRATSEVQSLRSAQNAPLLLRPDRRLGPLSACRFNPLQIGADGG